MNKFTFLKGFQGRRSIYSSGTIFPIIGDFAAYKYSGTSASLTKNTDRLTLTLNSAVGWVYGTTAIDLTNYRTLWILASTTHLTTGGIFDVQTSHTVNTHAEYRNIPANNAVQWISMDVSALNGTYYLRVGMWSSASLSINVQYLYARR